jgi:hypothetical protein
MICLLFQFTDLDLPQECAHKVEALLLLLSCFRMCYLLALCNYIITIFNLSRSQLNLMFLDLSFEELVSSLDLLLNIQEYLSEVGQVADEMRPPGH